MKIKHVLILEFISLKRLFRFVGLWIKWRRDFLIQAKQDWELRNRDLLPESTAPALYDLGCNACGAKWTGVFPLGNRGGKAECPDCRAMEGVIVRRTP